MNELKDGGPAFPSANDVIVGDCGTSGHPGMSLRDWFAGQALAVFANEAILAGVEKVFADFSVRQAIARFAYDISDAMLQAREQSHE